MKPEISIIVPVYNDENYLEDCLDSILAQSFQNFEIILVNDGSTDRSGSICEDYVNRDDRIKAIHQDYRGVSSARNVGVAKAEGEFIGFVDSDDRIDINMYKTLYELCKETGSHISICKLGREIDGKLINEESKEFIKEMDNEEGLRELFKGILFRFSLCNKLFKKSCFTDVVFPDGRIHEDLATTYKLFAAAEKSIYTNYIGYIYVKRQNSILTAKYHEKRLQAFLGWDEIIHFMNLNYSHLSTEYVSCFVYASIDHIYYIYNQVQNTRDQERYLLELQKYVRKHIDQIFRNDRITMKQKSLLTLLNYNISLLFLFMKFNKFIKRNECRNNLEVNL
jgi:glycosyltransferase involved in cell wall biosynthesis